MEEAAASLGASPLTIVPPDHLPEPRARRSLSGAALAFARAVGEFGSIVLISGNIPFDTQVSSVYIFKQIERDTPTSAAAVSVVLLGRLAASCWSSCACSSAGGAAMTASRGWIALRVVALGYLALLLLVPVGVVFYRTFEPGVGAVCDSITTPAAISAFWLTIEIAAIAVPLNTVFGVAHRARARARPRSAASALLEALIDLPFAISPVVVGLALVLLYGRDGWFGDARRRRDPGDLLAARASSWRRSSSRLPFVVREVAPGAARDRRRAGAGRRDARRVALADVLAHHAAGDPLGPRLRRRAVAPRARSASSAR